MKTLEDYKYKTTGFVTMMLEYYFGYDVAFLISMILLAIYVVYFWSFLMK